MRVGYETRVEFLVFRESPKERTAALVRATVTSPRLVDEVTFLASLRRAVTAWVRQTAEGADAWEDSSADFNVGDLSYHTGEVGLIDRLRGVGIYGLEIQTLVGMGAGAWSYDTVLADPPEEE